MIVFILFKLHASIIIEPRGYANISNRYVCAHKCGMAVIKCRFYIAWVITLMKTKRKMKKESTLQTNKKNLMNQPM